jgi:hypothetical protein
VDSNKIRKTSPNGYEEASSWRRLPTIDTDQYVALVVGNNILKFHQDRTTNEPPISDGSGCEKNSIFLSFSPTNSLSPASSFFLLFFLLFFSAATCCPHHFFFFFFFLVFFLLCTKVHMMVGPSHRREHPPNNVAPSFRCSA